MRHSALNARDAQNLLDAISACAVQPPSELSGLLETLDAIHGAGAQPDPTVELIKDVFKDRLPARAERSAMHAFAEALENGAADAVIASLTPRFDTAASALAECAALIDPGMDAAQVLESSGDDRVRVAWQSIGGYVNTLEQVGRVVAQFGCKSLTFGMVELPGNLSGIGALDDRALMCVDNSKLGIVAAGALFSQPGSHRRSPGAMAASALKLNDIATARETIRAWAEASWDATNSNVGRGRFEGETFVPSRYPTRTR